MITLLEGGKNGRFRFEGGYSKFGPSAIYPYELDLMILILKFEENIIFLIFIGKNRDQN